MKTLLTNLTTAAIARYLCVGGVTIDNPKRKVVKNGSENCEGIGVCYASGDGTDRSNDN